MPLDGRITNEMDASWRAYLAKREERPKALRFGWNPKNCFDAGFLAGMNLVARDDAEVRSSGWANHDQRPD